MCVCVGVCVCVCVCRCVCMCRCVCVCVGVGVCVYVLVVGWFRKPPTYTPSLQPWAEPPIVNRTRQLHVLGSFPCRCVACAVTCTCSSSWLPARPEVWHMSPTACSGILLHHTETIIRAAISMDCCPDTSRQP